MLNEKTIALVAQVLLIAAALNWGLNAYNGADAVKMIVGAGDIEKYIKYAIAAAGLYAAYHVLM